MALGLTGSIMTGVHMRLASPATHMRRWAAIIARRFSLMMAVEEPIDFDEFPKAMEEWLKDAEKTPVVQVRSVPGGGGDGGV